MLFLNYVSLPRAKLSWRLNLNTPLYDSTSSEGSRSRTTSRGHYRGEQDGEATSVVQFNVVHASAIDSSTYIASSWVLIHLIL